MKPPLAPSRMSPTSARPVHGPRLSNPAASHEETMRPGQPVPGSGRSRLHAHPALGPLPDQQIDCFPPGTNKTRRARETGAEQAPGGLACPGVRARLARTGWPARSDPNGPASS